LPTRAVIDDMLLADGKEMKMTTESEVAIRGLIKAFVDSWNRHDMTMLAALFAEDADFVDVFGNWFKDRIAIKQALTERHATVFKDSLFTEKDFAVRFVKPDLAIVHSVIELSGASDRQGHALPPGLGVITAVIQGVAGGWRIVALQNTAIAAQQPAVR
jgi:uncharacterized protein (TIGR02246 family)